MTLRELLASDGLKTNADIDRARGSKSRYDYLRERYGEVNADRIMRNQEVRSWDLPAPKGRR